MAEVRTRFAPSPTGYMHVGNFRTALYEYLIARSSGGKFVLRIEDTDQARLVAGSVEVIYDTLKIAGLDHDEGPDVGGDYGPYVQSERKGYLEHAKRLVETGKAYYCFCGKHSAADEDGGGAGKTFAKYDRRCCRLSKEEIAERLANGAPYVIRQLIPEGRTAFHDEVYGDVSAPNDELDDQILIKSDGMPTYNFANVIDDHLMEITHVVRGCEYLSSTPKYNLLYEALGWEIPTYAHLPLVLNEKGEKLSKRKGDASFEDLLNMGFLPEAIVNFTALLGWSPGDEREFFTLPELAEAFDIKGLSKSPSVFDMKKLTWMNGEYFKRMDAEKFFEKAEAAVKKSVRREGANHRALAEMVRTRINFLSDIPALLDFIDELPDYGTELFINKKMKTDEANSAENLAAALPVLETLADWSNDAIYAALTALSAEMGIKNGAMLWPVRTALSGKPTSPCGATEAAEILGKEETLRRIRLGLEKLSKAEAVG